MKAKFLAILMVLCLTVGLLAGCTGKTTASPTTRVSMSPTADVSAKPSEDPNAKKYGGDLVLAVTGLPNDFFLPGATAKGNWITLGPAAEPLGLQKSDGSFEPFLAENLIEDAKALTFTIKLKDGVKFHDGSDFDADALVWLFDRYVEKGTQANICNPDSYKAADKLTVVMTFSSYSNTWMETISQVHPISKEAYEKNGADYSSTNVVGTGPFVQTDYIEDNTLKFVKNDNYWQEGLPYLDSVTFMVIKDQNTQLSALTNGEVQGLNVSSGSLIAQLSANKDFKDISVLTPATASFFYIGVNSASEDSPFADVKVRQAFMYGLDRDASGKALTEGLATGLCQFAVEGGYNYLEKPTYTYDYDVNKAKTLLSEAGYPNGFETTVYVNSNFEKQAVALQAALQDIGITATISLLDSASFTDVTVNQAFTHVAINAGSIASYDPTTYFNRIMGAGRNRWKASMADFADLHDIIKESLAAETEDEHMQLCQQLGRYVNENLPHLPWYTFKNSYFTPNDLADTGMQEVQAFQWTPATAYFVK